MFQSGVCLVLWGWLHAGDHLSSYYRPVGPRNAARLATRARQPWGVSWVAVTKTRVPDVTGGHRTYVKASLERVQLSGVWQRESEGSARPALSQGRFLISC